jgi:hypothetical protein
VDLNCVQTYLSTVSVVVIGCGPVVSPRTGGDLGSRPVSSSRGLHIIGQIWVKVPRCHLEGVNSRF